MYRVCLLVLLGVWHVSAQITTPAPGTAVDCNAVGVQNCGACDVPGMTCATCPINYVLATDYKSCISCDVNCVNCVLGKDGKTGMCQQCAPNYVVRADGTCGQCGSYCAVCAYTDSTQTATVCTQCFPPPVGSIIPYLLGSYSKQCQDCTQVSSGCSACSEAQDKTVTCTGCMPGFVTVTSGTSKSCTACPSYCSSCSLAKGASTPTTCGTCVTNYVPNSAANPTYACLYCDPTKCSKCTTTGVVALPSIAQCAQCQKGYYLDSNNVCQVCPTGCATCTSASVCQTCVSSGFWLDSVNSKCTPCDIGCNTCSFNGNVETCTACVANFGFQSSQVSCQACPEHCDDCDDPQTCTSCEVSATAQYTLVDDVDGTFCLECPANCATCIDDLDGDAECQTCNNGYQAALDKNGNSFCFPCPAHCITCTIDPNTFAATCTQCVPDANNNDYYLNSNNNCVSCTSQCTNCNGGSDTCSSCQSGYFLDTSGTNPKCTKCSSANCLVCDFANNCTTTGCVDGFYIDANSICSKQCDTNCLCTNVATCTGCLKNPSSAPYNFYAAGACDYCDVKCTKAGCGAGGVCSTCVTGYMPDTNAGTTCIKCDVNCDAANGKCTVTGTTPSCTGCLPGYYVNAQNGCSKCSTSGCMTCTNNVCSACFAAYTSNGAATISCLANDAHCANGASTYDSTAKKVLCSTCTGLYTAGGSGSCLPNPFGCDVGTQDGSDSTGNTIVCSDCSEGYGLNSKNLCDPCPANCAECHQDAVSGLQVCDTCEDEYVENKFDCGACPEGCTTCKNVNGAMFCTQCSPLGYYLDSKNGVCIDCLYCSSCSASGCNPGTCDEGYGLASDQTCTDCADLTTVSGCTNCTDADSSGNSMCLDCGEGQVLDGWGANCVDASPLTNCDEPEFRPYECTPGKCNSPFSWVTMGPGRGQCGLVCAVCGDIDAGIYLPADQCQNSNNNYTEVQVVGACWVSSKKNTDGTFSYARGGTMQYNCTSDAQYEFASTTDSSVTFKCCQDKNGCSDTIILDGVAGASAISFSLALLFASILAALRLF